MKSGIIPINKPKGLSSFAVVKRVQRLFGCDKAGHTGTLDPMAAGVLPVLLGRAVKASEYMLTSDKHYIATLMLGITTDTEDITGTVLTECNEIPDEGEVLAAINSMLGESEQIPPMYSALKVDGKKLYELARQGITVEREGRPVRIESLTVTETDKNDEYILYVTCSKGTYIRTLCADIGAALGCGGVMASLRRTSLGGFRVEDAMTVTALKELSPRELEGRVLPTEELFADMDTVNLGDFYGRLAHSGCEIYQKMIKTAFPVGKRVRLYDKEGFFAIGEVREYPDGTAIKPIKKFRID